MSYNYKSGKLNNQRNSNHSGEGLPDYEKDFLAKCKEKELNETCLTKSIKEGITPETISYAECLGEYLAEGEKNIPLTSSQLRKFFGAVKKIQLNGYNKSDFVMLKPKLAYAVGRADEKNKISLFYSEMVKIIDTVLASEKGKVFDNFVNIFEAIVAYHKKYEQDNKKNNNTENMNA